MTSPLLRTVFSALGDFLFPRVCLVCEKDIEGEVLCRECFDSVYKIERNFCQLCGRPLERFRKKAVCSECIRHPLSLARIRAWARFTHPLDKVVYAFKYQRRAGLANYFSRHLAMVIASDPFLKSADALVPVPLFVLKSWWRGYNQSELLARSLAKRTGIAAYNPLARRRPTRTQTHLSSVQRRANVKDAFTLRDRFDSSLLRDKKLILLDDVITSGSTLDEAAEVLLDAGAAEIYGLTIGGAWIER